MIAISEKEDFEHELLNCGFKVSGMFKCGNHKSFAVVFKVHFVYPNSQKLISTESLDIF